MLFTFTLYFGTIFHFLNLCSTIARKQKLLRRKEAD